MKNTTIAFTCSLAGTLALLAINGGLATQAFGGNQRPKEAMVKYEIGHNRVARGLVESLPRTKIANVTPSGPAGSAQRIAIAWNRDRR